MRADLFKQVLTTSAEFLLLGAIRLTGDSFACGGEWLPPYCTSALRYTANLSNHCLFPAPQGPVKGSGQNNRWTLSICSAAAFFK